MKIGANLGLVQTWGSYVSVGCVGLRGNGFNVIERWEH
jgi:hypothetical protein